MSTASRVFHHTAQRLFTVFMLMASFSILSNALPAYAADEILNNQPRPVLEVPHTKGTVPSLTANIADPAWTSSAMTDNFSLALGTPKGLSPVPTQVQALWDANNLYIRFICKDNEIYCPFAGRDNTIYRDDAVEVFLDPKGDGKQYFELQVSPKNDVFDQLFLCTGEPTSDKQLVLDWVIRVQEQWRIPEWNLDGLCTAANVIDKGNGDITWIVDIAIPAKSTLKRLGMTKFIPMTMRINLVRYEWPSAKDAKTERALIPMNWAPVLSGNPHTSPAAMGYLKLLPE